jgi:Zn-finger nucleic acid-binding protein
VAKHKCPCGCGTDIVTTLSPTRWKLIYDGETVSLSPSIGNWTHPCKSHYYIENDTVIWAKSFSKRKMQDVVETDLRDQKEYYKKTSSKFKSLFELFKKKL